MALHTEGLTLHRGGQRILDAVSLSVRPGEVLGLLGANGAGKSTLLAVLAGELKPERGIVCLDEHPISALSLSDQARRRAVLPQNPSLNFDLGVSEVVAMGAYPFPELPPDSVASLTRAALATADVSHLADRRYVELSGGEQQRVQFARVLVQCHAPDAGQPHVSRYLLLDEPIASLDPKHQIGLMRATQVLAHTHGMGIMVIMHDLNLAARWCDRLVMLADARIAAAGPPEHVLTPALLRAVFDMQTEVIAHPTAPGRLLVLSV